MKEEEMDKRYIHIVYQAPFNTCTMFIFCHAGGF